MIISVKNLTKSYPYYKKEAGLKGVFKNWIKQETLYSKAVDNINFPIKQGELVGLLGPNGAGKTTTLKMLSGILHPTIGEVNILGFNPYKKEKKFLKQLALVMGQKNQLIVDLPAIDSFKMYKEIYEVPDKEYQKTFDELVELLGVASILEIPVRKLSLGQRMKCELIAALLHSPKVLLLDEPTIGLDVIAQKNIRDFLKRLNKEKGTTILLTSHYMEDIKQLCERVIIINLGKVIYDGKLQSLINKYATSKMLQVTFDKPLKSAKSLEKFGTVAEFNPYGATIKVLRSDAKKAAVKLLTSTLPIDDILIEETDLDDVIREIFS
jgi:ABC-2 type transport system ATP-binding protein